jgi:hypothetical protein
MDRLTIRRKLLQGSLSAPLVLTVTAAGAQARTTFGACLAATANQVPPMERLAEITGTDAFGNKLWQDTWYRTIVPLTKVAYQGNSGNKPDEYYIPQKGTGKYFKLDASNPYTVSPTGPMDLPTGGNVTVTQSGEVAALAFLDMHGGVTNYAWESNSGSFTTKSCHASVFA